MDFHARLLAPVLGRHLKCTVVVINRPGGGGLVAMNDFYESPKKDGLTLAITGEGLPFAQLIGDPGVRFDVRKFGWIISLYKEFRYLVVGIDSPYKSWEDLKNLKQPKAAVTSPTSQSGIPTILAFEVLGLERGKVIAGYPGSTEILLALKRLEADFTVISKSHALRKNPLVRPLLAMEETRAPEFPDIPSYKEMPLKPEAKRMMEIVMLAQAAGRSIVTPPGVPKEKVGFLRKVFATLVQDADYLGKIEKAGYAAKPLSGDETAAKVKQTLSIKPAELKMLKYLLFEKYL